MVSANTIWTLGTAVKIARVSRAKRAMSLLHTHTQKKKEIKEKGDKDGIIILKNITVNNIFLCSIVFPVLSVLVMLPIRLLYLPMYVFQSAAVAMSCSIKGTQDNL